MSRQEPSKTRRDIIVLVVCSVILVAGRLIEVEDDRVLMGGMEAPSVCWVPSALPEGCPGCGLSRSVVAFCRFRWVASFGYHPAGILFGLLLVSQVIYRLACLLGVRGDRLRTWAPRASSCVMLFVVVVSLAQWFGRAL